MKIIGLAKQIIARFQTIFVTFPGRQCCAQISTIHGLVQWICKANLEEKTILQADLIETTNIFIIYKGR
jgi:hypothetical protein